MPADNQPAGDDMKRLIASNLETVHWAELQAQASTTERCFLPRNQCLPKQTLSNYV